ncbi:Putative multidrug export ATP-binding/permease protein [Aurantimicrobium photophilum]|uniref:Multidrug export ATP-binding/permease protein n=1 Tax=Aurantimicrobium photophilum TaxID=1987356 RepID=A0A2Z3RZM0_9MICO|nr:ABC transporter ATP-binding protein [Aurantimicrobium photophilum]AWR22147.1 Putative multidrug export ATP-binding/permease protein [Aurantimicrobium photophilum]
MAITQQQSGQLSTFSSLRRVYPFVQGALPLLFVGIFVSLAAVATALTIPFALRWLVDNPLSTGDVAQIVPGVAVIFGLGMAEVIFIYLRRWITLAPGVHLEGKMRNAIYVHLQKLPVSFHDKWQSGQLLSRAMGDISTVRRWISFALVQLVTSTIMLVAGFTLLFAFNAVLGAIFLICSLPLIIISLRFQRTFTTLARNSQDQQGDLATSIEESVHGIRVLKSFGRAGEALEEFLEQANILRGTELAKGKANGQMWFWMLLIPDLGFAITLLIGIIEAEQGIVSVGTLIAFFATAALLKGPMQSIAPMLSISIEAASSLNRFHEVMDTPIEILEVRDAKDVPAGPGELVFDDVHFRYEDSPAHVPDLLDGVNLTIKPGETMALVGLTGCGKTSLTALTTRLFDVTGGRILIDGADIRDVGIESLRTRVAMAFEDATLFSISVRDNVLLGREDLTNTENPVLLAEGEALLQESLDIAQADFARSLPKGVESKIGEEGLSLSGGQRQRLALARAIAVQPSILVLDDPLSALDVTTEAAVEKALREVLGTTTALIVAHRPSTVMLADRVALLHNGKILDVGTHAELLARCPEYRNVIASLEEEKR